MNRECTAPGGGVYPISGDVQSTAGNARVVVIGLQNVPIAATPPSSGAMLQYNGSLNQWQPTSSTSGNSSIQVNGTGVSDDYWVAVNAAKQVLINGV